MRIGIDASRANRRPRTGVEWYSYELIQCLKELPETEAHQWRLYTNAPLQEGLETMPANWREERLSWPLPYLWTQARLSYEMMKRSPDVLFVPAHVLPRITPKKTVVTVHDVGFRRFPQLYKPAQIAYHEISTQEIVKKATRIITVSEFSKREIVELYRANPDRIFVTPLGIRQDLCFLRSNEEQARVREKFVLKNSFFLSIGRWEKKKNTLGLIRAFEQFVKETNGMEELVLVGLPGSGWAEIQRAYEDSPAKERIRFLGYVSESEKGALLSAATAYVHLAFYEGFGLPPLEAMACGCPVICSDVASLPEVVGRSNALWVAPDQQAQITDAMQTIVRQSSVRERLRVAGQTHVKDMTWKRTAEQTRPILTDWT
jgi:glycosyltransferase involved in cell wall biosynthesis